MKKILLASLLCALPVLATAEETAVPSVKPEVKEHHMQNSNPSAKPEAAVDHAMKNTNPAAKPVADKPKEHVMRNN